MLSDLRTDLVLTSPVVSSALRDELRRGERAVRVTTAVHAWADFQAEWDFAGEVVVLDALLDDHVPLPLKVRALRRLGSRPVVLGPGRDTTFSRRVAAEGAQAWIEPSHGIAETAELIRDVAQHATPDHVRVEPAPPPLVRLSDRELQVLCLYAGHRDLFPAYLGRVLTLRTQTVRSHLERGRSRYRALGRPSHNRAVLCEALVEDGWFIPTEVWSAAGRL